MRHLWKTLPGFFTPDTPLYTEIGGEPLKGKRDYDLAKKLLAEAGYKNEPVILLVARPTSPSPRPRVTSPPIC